jgi:hypothetical protein
MAANGRIRAGALKAPYTPLRGLCRWVYGDGAGRGEGEGVPDKRDGPGVAYSSALSSFPSMPEAKYGTYVH